MNSTARQTIRITLLAENTAPDGLIAEHGFSVWIDTGHQRFLFDTGQGLALVHNAQRLGIDLARADALVLSHGHYDHTGGLSAFLAANDRAPVIYARGATAQRFSCHPDQPVKSIGMPEAILTQFNALPPQRRIELEAPRYLAPGIGITGPVPRRTTFEDAGGPFYFDKEREHPDPIEDDLSLWFETADGLVILTGCCHAGIVNTANHIRQISGLGRIHGLIGGLHLLHASSSRLEQTRDFIADAEHDGLGFVMPCHCTGDHVIDDLEQVFGRTKVRRIQAGDVVDIGPLSASAG